MTTSGRCEVPLVAESASSVSQQKRWLRRPRSGRLETTAPTDATPAQQGRDRARSTRPCGSLLDQRGVRTSTPAGALRNSTRALLCTGTALLMSWLLAAPAAAAKNPVGPTGPSVTVDLNNLTDKPSTPVLVILGMTLISLAPAILLTCTSFTKILVVLGLTRNALGLQQTPPNQVLAGLALFLSLFVMGPVLTSVNQAGLQPYLEGTKTSAEAFSDGVKPLRTFMLKHTDDDELRLLTDVAGQKLPEKRADVSMSTLVPAFVLTELKEAFIIGFIIFVPFLVIDMVVSGALMALGMMMMPPVMVSLPFKLLLFVMVDGWGLVIQSLVASYR